MKKRYLFMSSFFVIGTIITLIFFQSYRSYYADSNVNEQKTNPVDTLKEIRVDSTMKYVIENYDAMTGIVTQEETTVPAELAGKTRGEVEEYIVHYNQELKEKGVPDAPDSVELISFSKEKVVIRENYLGEEEEKGFFLKIQEGEVVIFHMDQVTPYEFTGIREEILPESEIDKLRKGYSVTDERELYSVLENLSS